VAEGDRANIPGKKPVLIILLILIVVNTFWFTKSIQIRPLIGMIFYGAVIFLIWRNDNFSAGMIAGIVGFTGHVFELFFLDLATLEWDILLFFLLNLTLPIFMFSIALKAYRTLKNPEEE
jgi:hypothetical protein